MDNKVTGRELEFARNCVERRIKQFKLLQENPKLIELHPLHEVNEIIDIINIRVSVINDSLSNNDIDVLRLNIIYLNNQIKYLEEVIDYLK